MDRGHGEYANTKWKPRSKTFLEVASDYEYAGCGVA
jgi:hypothetical protein